MSPDIADSATVMSEADRSFILSALAQPRGFYPAYRAAQLSGVPTRTVYHWATHDVLVPDHASEHPKMWSYRDLVMLRLIAFLRQHRVVLPDAAALARSYRHQFSTGATDLIATNVRAAQGDYAFGDLFDVGHLSGQRAFDIMTDIAGKFDLLAPIESGDATGTVRVRGPNLIRPSERTAISPWIMSGEPVIRNSRVTTATLLSLVEERALTASDVADLYPSLSVSDVVDAVEMERTLARPHQLAA